MEVSAVETLSSHPSAQTLGVGGQAGEGHAHVVVHRQDLLLVGGQLVGTTLEGHQDGVGGGLEAHGGGALLDGLHGVLHLVETTLRRPGRHVGVVLVAELKKKGGQNSNQYFKIS